MKTITCKEDLKPKCPFEPHDDCPEPYILQFGDKVIFNVKGEVLEYRIDNYALLVLTEVRIKDVFYLLNVNHKTFVEKHYNGMHHPFIGVTRLVIALYEEIEKQEDIRTKLDDRTITANVLNRPIEEYRSRKVTATAKAPPCPEYGKHRWHMIKLFSAKNFAEFICPCGEWKKTNYKPYEKPNKN